MMPGDLLLVAEPDYLGTLAGRDEQKLCGKWMPRKKTTCARTSGHGGDCKTAELMERQRAYRRSHPNRQASESHKKSNRKARIANYGLTLEDFVSCCPTHSRPLRLAAYAHRRMQVQPSD